MTAEWPHYLQVKHLSTDDLHLKEMYLC